MFDASEYWITVVELSSFAKAIDGTLTSSEVEGLVAYLAQHPDDGDIIPGTGGVRKLRWGARGKGKRGGARVIYYFRDLNMPVYLLTAYVKGEKINLSKREQIQLGLMAEELVKQCWDNAVVPRVHKIARSTPAA